MEGSLDYSNHYYVGQQYQHNAPFAIKQNAVQKRYHGVLANIAPQLIRDYRFDTARPSSTMSVIPTSADLAGSYVDLSDSSKDPLRATYAWTDMLQRDGHVRGDQRFIQFQSDTITKRQRGLPNAFTPEIYNPRTGASSNMVSLAYMPQYPSATQVKLAYTKALDMGAGTRRRNYDNYRYWRNANQSFRYSEKKG